LRICFNILLCKRKWCRWPE